MWKKNDLTEKLGIEYPIIQGPFGGGFSTSLLTATVSNSGGLGSFGAHNLSPTEIKEKVTEIRSLTKRPFAVNLWVSDHDDEVRSLNREDYIKVGKSYQSYFDKTGVKPLPFTKNFGESFDEQVEALIEAAPPAFSFVFGIPSQNILEKCRKKGIITIGAATTLAEALAIEKSGIDLVVATGFEAGGHRPSFLKSAEASLMGTLSLVPLIADNVKIPVIAAGGISNGKGIVANRVLGAQGFQLGTAFLACEESGASYVHREKIFSTEASDTVLSRAYTGRLARFIRNQFLHEVMNENKRILPFPAQSWLLKNMKDAALSQGNENLTSLYAGQGAPQLRYRNASQLMTSLISEVENLINQQD